MTYQQFQNEITKREASPLYRSLMTIRQAVRRCAPEERERMKAWTDQLERLTAMTEAEYYAVRDGIFKDLSDMISDYRASGELFAAGENREAMAQVFSALELDGRSFDVPGFVIPKKAPEEPSAVSGAAQPLQEPQPIKEPQPSKASQSPAMLRRAADPEKAAKALAQDPLDYAAQFMAYLNRGEKASPGDMLESLGRVFQWKRDSALRMMAEDKESMDRLFAGDFEAFEKSFLEKRTKIQENSRSFKAYRDEIAGKYRAKEITYAELELRMEVLRELTKGRDPENLDETLIYPPDFDHRLQALRDRQAAPAEGPVSPEEYQKQLAESCKMPFEEQAQRIVEVYGAKAVFHPEFIDARRLGYTRASFNENLPDADLRGVLVGGKELSNEEFASLAVLAAYDPEIGGVHVETDSGLAEIAPSEDVSLHFRSRWVAGFGDTPVDAEGGSRLGPDEVAGLYIPAVVKPAREKVIRALEAYQNSDRTQLLEIIAKGLQYAVNQSRHGLDRRGAEERIAGDKASPDHELPDSAVCADEKMLEGALSLLQRDEKLSNIAPAFGVTEEMQKKAMGFLLAHRIMKAGQAAAEKLRDAAGGGKQLSEFEKNQCMAAVLRRNMLAQSLKEHEEALEQNPLRKEIDEKAGKQSENLKPGDEDLEKKQIIEARRGRKLLELSGTPSVYLSLGKSGVSALDNMVPDMRRERTRLQKLGAYELAMELGVTRQRDIKTTAQDIYNDLTKDYKAGLMPYALYEARLRAMRVMTNGRKQAKIDLETVDEYLARTTESRGESLSPVDAAIRQKCEDTFAGELGSRLRNIYNMYGLKPKAAQESLTKGSFTADEFAQLEDFQEKKGENHLPFGDGSEIAQDEFAVLAIAATQVYPTVGGKLFDEDKNEKKIINILNKPTVEDAITLRSMHVTEAHKDKTGARKGFGHSLVGVVLPARKKVEEALRQYNGGAGSPKELGKILGMGLHNLLDSAFLIGQGGQALIGDSLLEGAMLGGLARIAEKHPDLMKEALKYTNREELDKAKGLQVAYDIVRAAQEAKEKLKESAKNHTPLDPTERKACIELMLREKALTISASQQASTTQKTAAMKKLEESYYGPEMTKVQSDPMTSLKMQNKFHHIIGLPDYVRTLGVMGPAFARDMLDAAMPGREEFFKKSNKEILNALDAKIGSDLDPFQNKEYTQKTERLRPAPGKTAQDRQKQEPQTTAVRKP